MISSLTKTGETRRKIWRVAGCLFLFLGLSSIAASAQSYCTPANTQGTPYFFSFQFMWPVNGGPGNPQNFSNQNSAYTNNTSSGSAGTYRRYFATSSHYAVSNPSGAPAFPNAQVKVFVDWNSDGDFNDAHENQYTNAIDLNQPNLSHNTHAAIAPPIGTPPGTYRMRFALAQSGTASACGAFVGETEDFAISVGNNTAPLLDNSDVPFINRLLTTQTDNDGFPLERLFATSTGVGSIVSDADDYGSSLAPRGIAVTSQSASNGTWQYRIGNGMWTAFGAVSATNALLLSSAGPTAWVSGEAVRLRFVPTGPGTPSFTFRAWDATTGTSGTYADATVNGGTTAFSTAEETAAATVTSSVGASPLELYMALSDSATRVTSFDQQTGAMMHPRTLPTATAQQFASDIVLDGGSNQLFWTDWLNIYRSGTDGSGQTSVATGLSFCTGVAAGNNYVFYNDYDTQNRLFRVSSSGTGIVSLLDVQGGLQTADVGYFGYMNHYNGKLYVWVFDANFIPHLMRMNEDGTDLDTVHSPSQNVTGLHVVNDTAFWIEMNSNNTVFSVMRKAANGQGSVTTVTTGIIPYNYVLADPANNRLLALAGKQLYAVDMTTGTAVLQLALEGNPMAMSAAIQSSTPLDVRLLSWSAQAMGNRALLEWRTASENTGTCYGVERSVDGRQYTQIGTVTGSNAGYYRFTDEQPVAGANYYRLATHKADGSHEYTAVRQLYFDNAEAVAVYPSPFGSEGFSIRLPQGTALPVAYTITNAAGRVVQAGQLTEMSTRIAGANMRAGTYILHCGSKAVQLVRQ